MSDVTIELCDPRDRADGIRSLFARNDSPNFDLVFERTYRVRADHGLRSWVGVVDGEIVMHIGMTPLRFEGAGTSQVVGILGDLMVAASHRDFWAPVKLLRRLVQDLKRAGEVDALITTTVSDAEAVFKAGGFKAAGSLRRYVLPLSRPYLAVRRITRGIRSCTAVPGEPFTDTGHAPVAGAQWRPGVDAGYYSSRVPRAEFMDANWLAVTRSPGQTRGWAMLSRNGTLPEMSVADLFWARGGPGLGEVVHAAARWAGRQGFSKLSLTTVHESDTTRDLEQAGFLARDVRSTLLVTQLGSTPPPAVRDWFLPGFAITTW